MKTKLFLLVSILALAILLPTPARADGIIIPEPPICDPGPCPPRPPIAQLAIHYHHVQVTIQDQIAVTHVDQVFYNPNDWQVEGTYIFPLPQGAVVTEFILWVDGEPVEGKILDAEEARRTYEEIVYRLRDPALLEYSGRGAMQARIFPIPPRGERRVELEYSQVLTADAGLVRYTYPLSTEKFSVVPLEEVSISVQVSSSSVPIRAVYSPSHPVAVDRLNSYQVNAGYEAYDVLPDTDFTLYYSLGEEQAFHLVTYRDANDPEDKDGFFLLLLAPRPDAAQKAIPKDVILVLDRSGSMEGEKFQQARQALGYILQQLNPDDRFNVIAFSTGMESYAGDLRHASEASEASAWVERLSAQGSTDINRALLEAAAMVQSERPTYLIFLTDGLPTEGVVDSQQILDNLAGSALDNLRLFVFGVGYDVDTFLLDSLAQAHHGTSTYVTPGEQLDEVLSDFYARVSSPVMTDLELEMGEAGEYDVYPNPLPDLFAGAQIVVVGRYSQPGRADITLSGRIDGETQTFRFADQQFAIGSDPGESSQALPRLWATRKVGHLLNLLRLQGPDQETIDQIVRLSIRYGIVTPYTSYLVTEEMPLGAAEQERIAGEQFSQIQSAPSAPVFGQEAVQKAADQGALAGAEAPVQSSAESASSIRQIGTRTFVFTDGVWVDTGYDPDTMDTIKVQFLSEEYLSLVYAHPELAAGFAVGTRVIALSQGRAFEVVEEAARVDPQHQVLIPTLLAQQEATPTPDTEPVPTSDSGEFPSADGSVAGTPCLSGLIPLIILPVFMIVIIWRKRNG
jgi:Ca-activated chloride channel family protein